jgi:hypothetical protein
VLADNPAKYLMARKHSRTLAAQWRQVSTVQTRYT